MVISQIFCFKENRWEVNKHIQTFSNLRFSRSLSAIIIINKSLLSDRSSNFYGWKATEKETILEMALRSAHKKGLVPITIVLGTKSIRVNQPFS